ncbi:MAG: phosphoglycerate dehydrogenase [Defluviitaleaceae bacterium]|nr:phosphoglycerate dehydrogenase [Defluviitaleaceae bacterium]
MPKILITPRSFAQYSSEPYEKLKQAGIDIVKNPTGGVMSKEEMISHVKEVDGIILGIDPMDADVLAAGQIKVVSKYGVGTDNIDLSYCENHNITVTITQNANSNAVADYAFALLLAVARRMVEIDNGCRKGDWSKKVAVDVYGKKIGIVGLGTIGRGVAERAKGFNMAVYGYDIYLDETYLKENNISFMTVDEMIRTCDFISLHMPLTDDTRNLINSESLKLANTNLIVINTARGGIINEDDLYEALKNNVILGAGIDVFEHEPAKDSKLLELDNVIAGSHCAASTVGAVDTMSNMAVDNVICEFRKRGLIK